MRDRSVVARTAMALVAALVGVTIPVTTAAATDGPRDTGRTVFAFGAASFYGSTGGTDLSHPIVGVTGTPTGLGYWLVASDGGIFSYGDARFHGSTGAITLNRPIVGIAATRRGHGYWTVASDGGIFAFGDARFHGSTGGMRLNDPIVGMAATPTGHGYWLVASDGGIFAFGDARFHGSTGGMRLNDPIVGMAATPTGHGYWLVASDGGIFAFGDARFHGSTGGLALHRPIVGIASTPTGHGYWLVTSAGRVFARGDARAVLEPASSASATESIVGVATRPARSHSGQGFWLAASGDPPSSAKVEAAISWFEARMGSGAYEGLCETAVEVAYGTISRYPTAYDDWRSQPDQHLDWQNAPRGALVFYDTTADGHVAISLGNGYVASTSVYNRIGVAPIGFFQNPLGWAYEPW